MYSKVTRLSFLLAVPVFITLFAGFYLLSSYEELSTYFTGLNNKFYRAEHWNDFFTPGVRSAGLIWCALAVPASWLWFLLVRKHKLLPDSKSLPYSPGTYGLIALAGLIASSVMYLHTPPAADEVFSALNFASLPALQCAAYYPIPNNHVLYNLISGLFSGFSDELLLGPRIISMLAYILTLFTVYGWLKEYIRYEWAVVTGLVMIAFQFSVWGFSAQGRGYALMTLCSVLSLKGLLAYLKSGDTGYLGIYMFTIACGMFIVPSFLIWGMGLSAMAIIHCIMTRKVDRMLLRYSVAAWLLSFLCYVPLLSFSGIGSLADNPYVRGFEGSRFDFLPVFFGNYGYFSGLYQEWFTVGIGGAFALLLLPLLSGLIRKPDNNFTRLLLVYVSFAAGFILVSIALKNLAFYRNLSAHALLVHFVIVVSVFRLVKNKTGVAICCLILAGYTGAEVFKNYKRVHSCLYYYDVRSTRNEMQECLPPVRSGTDVFIDNEAFYAWTMLNERDRSIRPALNRKNFRGQELCILHKRENFLKDSARYIQTDTCMEYLIYQRSDYRFLPVR